MQHNDLSPFRSVTLRLSSSDETQIAPALQAVAQELTGQVSLGSYPVSTCGWHVLFFLKLTCSEIWLRTQRLVSACFRKESQHETCRCLIRQTGQELSYRWRASLQSSSWQRVTCC